MHTPVYEAALAEARLERALWRLLLGVGLCVFVYLTTAVSLMVAVGFVIAGQQGLFAVMPFFTGLATPDTPVEVFVLLGTFLGMALGPVLAAAALHGRGPGSLLGAGDVWLRGFAAGLLAVAVIYGPLLAAAVWLDPPVSARRLHDWLWLLPLGLPLLMLQIAAEELLFRGYLQQQLAVRFTARWVWFGGPAAIFALLHTSPEVGWNLPIVLAATFVFGLLAADLSERTGSLGAAMGLHFANNFFAIFVLAGQGTITGVALFTSTAPPDALGWPSVMMAASIPMLLATWRVTRAILRV